RSTRWVFRRSVCHAGSRVQGSRSAYKLAVRDSAKPACLHSRTHTNKQPSGIGASPSWIRRSRQREPSTHSCYSCESYESEAALFHDVFRERLSLKFPAAERRKSVATGASPWDESPEIQPRQRRKMRNLTPLTGLMNYR